MTVYVSDGKSGRGARMTSNSALELSRFRSALLGRVRRQFFEWDTPLTPTARQKAITLGAVQVTNREYLAIRAAQRRGLPFDLFEYRHHELFTEPGRIKE